MVEDKEIKATVSPFAIRPGEIKVFLLALELQLVFGPPFEPYKIPFLLYYLLVYLLFLLTFAPYF